MLNTDMQLMDDIDSSVPAKNAFNRCPAFASSVAPGRVTVTRAAGCPFLSANAAMPNFAQQALLFAEGDVASQGEPGATRWMAAFIPAWRKMTELAYSSTELTCPSCVPPYCPQCTLNELCFGQVSFPLRSPRLLR
jgi:hypothetical protein